MTRFFLIFCFVWIPSSTYEYSSVELYGQYIDLHSSVSLSCSSAGTHSASRPSAAPAHGPVLGGPHLVVSDGLDTFPGQKGVTGFTQFNFIRFGRCC